MGWGGQKVVLVFCQPSEEVQIDKNYNIYPYAPVSYCKWLSTVGAKCIPLPYNTNEGSIEYLIERSTGLLIPGGGSNLYKSYFEKEGLGPVMTGFLKIWRFLLKLWNKGVHYPVWGTCLGFEMVLIALSNDVKVLSNLNSRGHQVEIISEYSNSKLFHQMPIKLRMYLEHKKLINFHHMHGISVNKFQNYPKLQEKLKITGISKDKNGKWFCSVLEGK